MDDDDDGEWEQEVTIIYITPIFSVIVPSPLYILTHLSSTMTL